MNSTTIASMMSGNRPEPRHGESEGVVEIGLLLPAQRAAALLRLARDRRESVGHLLRKMIDRELAERA
jgi:hypothetical protein